MSLSLVLSLLRFYVMYVRVYHTRTTTRIYTYFSNRGGIKLLNILWLYSIDFYFDKKFELQIYIVWCNLKLLFNLFIYLAFHTINVDWQVKLVLFNKSQLTAEVKLSFSHTTPKTFPECIFGDVFSETNFIQNIWKILQYSSPHRIRIENFRMEFDRLWLTETITKNTIPTRLRR